MRNTNRILDSGLRRNDAQKLKRRGNA
jgi:hypothetical protein